MGHDGGTVSSNALIGACWDADRSLLGRVGITPHPRYFSTATDDGILNRWLFAGGDRQVRDVLVNGQWVVRDGRHAGEEDSSRAFTQVLRELLG